MDLSNCTCHSLLNQEYFSIFLSFFVCGLVEKSAYTTRYGWGEEFDYRRWLIVLDRYEEIVRSEGFSAA